MYVKLAAMRWVKLFIVGQPADQKNVNGKGDHATLCTGDLDPHLIHSSRGAPEPSTQRHLDRFSRFCRTDYSDRPTDRPIDRTTRYVTIGRIYVRSTAMRPNNTAGRN